MNKKTIGEVFSKPIVLGNENKLKKGEYLLELKPDGSGKSVKERINNEVIELFTDTSTATTTINNLNTLIEGLQDDKTLYEDIIENLPTYQVLQLNQGWNWVSLYLDMENSGDDVFNQLLEKLPQACIDTQNIDFGDADGLVIKTQDAFTSYTGGNDSTEGSWNGALISISSSTAFMILIPSTATGNLTVTLNGHYIIPETDTLHPADRDTQDPYVVINPYPYELLLEDVFTNPTVGDRIYTLKNNAESDGYTDTSDRIYAEYYREEWSGVISALEPGKYYIYIPYKENPSDIKPNEKE